MYSSLSIILSKLKQQIDNRYFLFTIRYIKDTRKIPAIAQLNLYLFIVFRILKMGQKSADRI